MTGRMLVKWYLAASIIATVHFSAAETNAFDQALEGVDSDQDGVRDDVQSHIMREYPSSRRLQAALMQLAQSYQAWLRVPPKNADAAYAAAVASNRAVDCVYYVASDVNTAYAAVNRIKEWVVDSRGSEAAWLATDRLLGGTIFREDPGADTGGTCAFKPGLLPD